MLPIHHIDTATHLIRIGLLCFDSNAFPTHNHYNQLPSKTRPSKSEHLETYNIQLSPFSISFVPWWQPHLTRNTPFFVPYSGETQRAHPCHGFLSIFFLLCRYFVSTPEIP